MVMYIHNVTMCTSVHVRAKIMTSTQICTDAARMCTALHGYFYWPLLTGWGKRDLRGALGEAFLKLLVFQAAVFSCLI